MPYFVSHLRIAQQAFLNCSFEEAFIALVFALEKPDGIHFCEDWFTQNHNSILFILDELTEFTSDGYKYQFVCGFILSNSEVQAELIRALFHLDQAASTILQNFLHDEDCMDLWDTTIPYLKARIYFKLGWFSSARYHYFSFLPPEEVPFEILDPFPPSYVAPDCASSYYKARIYEHFPLSHTREMVNYHYLICLEKEPLNTNFLAHWLRFIRNSDIHIPEYTGNFSDFFNPVLRLNDYNTQHISDLLSIRKFAFFLGSSRYDYHSDCYKKYHQFKKELRLYFDGLSNQYSTIIEASESLYFSVYDKTQTLDSTDLMRLNSDHDKSRTWFTFGKYKSQSYLEVWRGTIHKLQNRSKIYTFLELLLNFLFHRLKEEPSIHFPFPIDNLEKYDADLINSDNSDLYLEFKFNKIIIHSSEGSKVSRYIDFIQKILSSDFHNWILAYKRERAHFTSSYSEYGERLIKSADELMDYIGNPTYIIWALTTHESFCIHPYDLNILRQSECLHLGTFETIVSTNSITFNPIFKHFIPEILPEGLFLKNIENWWERGDQNMEYDHDDSDSYYSYDILDLYPDDSFCGACGESPCMCSDPFQTSTLI